MRLFRQREMFLNEKKHMIVLEDRSQARYRLFHGGRGCDGGVYTYTCMLRLSIYPRSTACRCYF